jgi:hypothetical protein
MNLSWFVSGRTSLLHTFIRREVKLTVVTIGTSQCYQLQTQSYLQYSGNVNSISRRNHLGYICGFRPNKIKYWLDILHLSDYIIIIIIIIIIIVISGTSAQRGLWPPRPRGFLITQNDAQQSIGVLWTSDQLVAEISTWQHTTDNYPSPSGIRTHDRSRRAAVDLRLRPHCHWDRRIYQILEKNGNTMGQFLWFQDNIMIQLRGKLCIICTRKVKRQKFSNPQNGNHKSAQLPS